MSAARPASHGVERCGSTLADTTEEAAHATAFLASPLGCHPTGGLTDVRGGRSRHV